MVASTIEPLGNYYLTDGTDGLNFRISGTTVLQTHQHSGYESAIAVRNDVRTLGASILPYFGAQYNSDLVFTGIHYGLDPFEFYDGTDNNAGTNYSIDAYSGGVYSMNADWTNPVLMFTLRQGYLGITWEPSDTLWVSRYYDGSRVEHYAMDGTLLGSFDAGFSHITSLAMDYKDGTLWMGNTDHPGIYYQFNTSGTLLQTLDKSATIGHVTMGGEFSSVPEPSTLALVGAGLTLAAYVRRRRLSRP